MALEFDKDMIDDITDLRCQAVLSYDGVRTPVERLAFDDFWRNAVSAFHENQSWRSYRDANARIAAFFGYMTIWDDFFGQEIRHCLFHYRWQDPMASSWMKETLETHLPIADAKSWVTLQPIYSVLWPIFQSKGYGVGEVQFGGFPKSALKRLKDHALERPKTRLDDLGLELQELKAPCDVQGIVQLKSEIFQQQPEGCWYFHNPGIKDSIFSEIEDDLKTGRHWVITAGSEIMGYFAYAPSSRKAFGKEVGMDFAIHKSLQGKGIGRLAYQVMLEQMVQDGIDYFHGSTANPAVIRMAHHMQRPLLRLELRALSNCPDQRKFKDALQAFGEHH